MLCLPYYACVVSSTKLVIRAEHDLPGIGGEGGRGAWGRNDPNNVCTCEKMNKKYGISFHYELRPQARAVLGGSVTSRPIKVVSVFIFNL
jgi:hypothetical protein